MPAPRLPLLAVALAAALAAPAARSQTTAPQPSQVPGVPTTPPDAPSRSPEAVPPAMPPEIVPPSAAASAAAEPAQPPVVNSGLDAPLFYELLLGEIELRSGDAGAAYQLLLDAARKSREEALFRRATDVALQARAGEQALAAVVAWRQAVPDSQDALRYQVQILVALGRAGEAAEPLSAVLKAAPRPALPGIIDAVPRFLARTPDRAASARLVEAVLAPYADVAETRGVALVAIGRAWLAAGDTTKALALAQGAAQSAPASDGPALLAIDMLPATPEAEAIVKSRIALAPSNPALRMLYVRSLAGAQRMGDAAAEAEAVTKAHPQLAPPFLTLGAIRLELQRPADAVTALTTYVRLVEGGAAVVLGPTAAAGGDDDDVPSTPDAALTQAYLLLAQAAEQQRDFPGAERWLAKIDNPQRALDVQARRASLLAKQGKLKEARELIRRAPEQTTADARAKLLAEVALLRDAKQWNDSRKLLEQANAASPDDADLLYEQAMVEEKLDRMDDMERLLRRVIQLKPDLAHAYNALGYSLAERKVRLPEARTLIVKALELSPGEPFITDSLGWVEYRLGNRDEALRLLRKAYQARPDVEIGAHLGEVLWSAGQTEEARRVWREARARDSGNDVLKKTLARLRVDL